MATLFVNSITMYAGMSGQEYSFPRIPGQGGYAHRPAADLLLSALGKDIEEKEDNLTFTYFVESEVPKAIKHLLI